MQDWQDLGCLGSGYRCRGVRDQQNGLDEPFDGVPPVELHDHSTSGPPLSPSAVALLTTMVSTYLGDKLQRVEMEDLLAYLNRVGNWSAGVQLPRGQGG